MADSKQQAAAAMEDSQAKGEGPVMGMFHRKLRALKKKKKRITDIEEAKAAGKAVNAEQEDVLKQKAQVVVLIEEYEKLAGPLLTAVGEEAEEVKKAVEAEIAAKSSGEESGQSSRSSLETALKTILEAVYVGNPLQLDEETEDVKIIRSFASLLLGSSGGGEIHGSHKDAVEASLKHALGLLDSSDAAVSESFAISYSDVRQSLQRVVASEVFTSSNCGEPETTTSAAEPAEETTEGTLEPEPATYTETAVPVPAVSEQPSAPPLEGQQWTVAADGAGYQLGVPQEGILTAESASYGAVQQQLVDQAAQQQLEQQQQLQQEQLLQYQQQQQLYTSQESQQAQADAQKAVVEGGVSVPGQIPARPTSNLQFGSVIFPSTYAAAPVAPDSAAPPQAAPVPAAAPTEPAPVPVDVAQAMSAPPAAYAVVPNGYVGVAQATPAPVAAAQPILGYQAAPVPVVAVDGTYVAPHDPNLVAAVPQVVDMSGYTAAAAGFVPNVQTRTIPPNQYYGGGNGGGGARGNRGGGFRGRGRGRGGRGGGGRGGEGGFIEGGGYGDGGGRGGRGGGGRYRGGRGGNRGRGGPGQQYGGDVPAAAAGYAPAM